METPGMAGCSAQFSKNLPLKIATKNAHVHPHRSLD